MSTRINSGLQEPIDLFTKTPIIKRNYYALYVDNPQVSYIRRIWNQMIFFLFSRCGSFLGAAADQRGKISVRQEFTLINKYNEAKDNLHKALIEFDWDSNAKNEWEDAKTQYTQVVYERIKQLTQTFGFSNEVEDQELGVDEEKLKEAISGELNQMVAQYKFEAPFIDTLELPFTPSPSAQKELKKEDLKEKELKKEQALTRKAFTEAKEALKNQLQKTPHLVTLDNPVWDSYKKTLEALQALEKVTAKEGSSDFAFFYKQLQNMIQVMDQYHDKQTQFKIMQQLAVALELPQKDPEFLPNYLSAMRNNYVTFEFGSPFILDRKEGKALLLLKDYAEAAKNVCNLVPLTNEKPDPISFATKHLFLLLSELAECEHLKAATKWESSLSEIVKNLDQFKKAERNEQTMAFVNRFVNSSSSSSQSTSASVSSSTSSESSSSSSSSTSRIASVPKEEEDTFGEYSNAKNALVVAFVMEGNATKILESVISRFVAAAKNHAEKNPTSGLLNFVAKDSAFGDLEQNITHNCGKAPEILFQILTLKVNLAREWNLCTLDFFHTQINALIANPEFHELFFPGKPPLAFCTFYNKIKELYKSFNEGEAEKEATDFAKLKLRNLCDTLYIKQYFRFESYIRSSEQNSASKPSKAALTVSQAILNFVPEPSEAQKAQIESFLSSIVKMSAGSFSLPIARQGSSSSSSQPFLPLNIPSGMRGEIVGE